jgi:Zn-dependent protease with chaperone function
MKMLNKVFFSRLRQTREVRDWWNIRKLGFKKRMIVLSLVIASTTLYVVFADPLMKLLWLLVLLCSAELFTFIYTPIYVTNLWLRLTYKKKTIPMTEAMIAIPEQITNLVNEVGVKVDEFRVQPSLRNAYVIGKTVVIGLPLIKELEPDEVLAIVAHELGHIKQKPSAVRALIMLGGFLSIWSWFTLPIQIFIIASLAYFTVIMIPFNWVLECQADRVAKRFVGSVSLHSALLKISDRKNLNEPSEDHPSISNRLKLLKKSNS